MMPLRLSASDSARRTRTSPSAAEKVDTMNASVDHPGPWYTLTDELCSSWFSVAIPPALYEPWIAPVSIAEVNDEMSGAPLTRIWLTSGLTDEFQYCGFATAVTPVPGLKDLSLYAPVHMMLPAGVP